MSDAMVLAAQTWLNSTYGSVTGYVPCVEDGNTGNQTIGCIIMGLQHELQISPVVANLGPTTWNHMVLHGTVSSSETNAKIVTLLQCAMYCKGYDGDALSGTWDDGRLAAGLKSIQEDIGYNSSQTVGSASPKLFRALLNTDAYVLIPGGDSRVRAAQRWLNLTYIGRENFFYAPCDGFFSRNVQQALVYGLQYELGQSDAVADGAYGPGTASQLQANTSSVVVVGSSDGTHNWVHLFKAAMIFNAYFITFNGSFAQADSNSVVAFQTSAAFTTSDRTGQGDFRTWAELLVSTGDPTRPGTGADAASTITAARATTLRNAGYKTIGRYLTNAPQSGALDKKIKPGELATIFASGLTVFPIFEENGDSAAGITYARGVQDMNRATAAAIGYGFFPNTTIYYAVDFDATDADVASNVLPYFRGLRDAKGSIGSPYGIAIYASRHVCTEIIDAGLAITSFVDGLSTGYSGNLGFPLPQLWSFNQIAGETLDSGGPGAISIDKDIQSGSDAGQSSVSPTPPPPDPDPNANFFAMLSWLQIRAQTYHDVTPGSASPEILLAQYCRGSYNGLQWQLFGGQKDASFLTYVASELSSGGLTFPLNYHEPSTGQDYDIGHLFATMNAYLYLGVPGLSTEPEIVELAGWAGDLTTTLDDFAKHGSGQSIVDFAAHYVADPNSDALSFSLEDFNQDVDAYNIAAAFVQTTGSSIPDLVKELLSSNGSYPSRYSTFYRTRFGSDRAIANTVAGLVFLMPNNTSAHEAFNNTRSAVLLAYNPSPVLINEFTTTQLQDLGDAFVNALLAL